MKNKVLVWTLFACAVAGFLFTLARYMWSGGNPSARLGYGIVVSLVPALLTLPLLKVTKLTSSWEGAAAVYVLLFAAISAVQFYGRTI